MLQHDTVALAIVSPMGDDTSRNNNTPLREDTSRNNGTGTSNDNVSLTMGPALKILVCLWAWWEMTIREMMLYQQGWTFQVVMLY